MQATKNIMNKYVTYVRVSTNRQSDSGLSLDNQNKKCNDYIASQNGELIGEFKDIESGKSRTRKGLLQAIDVCKKNGSTLVIAKLDRLARDIEFTFKVINTGIDIHFCDMPQINTMILGVFASVAQYERELISTRTKDALKAKKARDGSWSDQWGKNTGASREDVQYNASIAAAKLKTEGARNNPNNVFFWQFITNWQKKNKGLELSDHWKDIVIELNSLKQTTATGLEFNESRARNMWHTLKRVMK